MKLLKKIFISLIGFSCVLTSSIFFNDKNSCFEKVNAKGADSNAYVIVKINDTSPISSSELLIHSPKGWYVNNHIDHGNPDFNQECDPGFLYYYVEENPNNPGYVLDYWKIDKYDGNSGAFISTTTSTDDKIGLYNGEDTYYKWVITAYSKLSVTETAITLDPNGGTAGATTEVTATNGEAMPAIASDNLPTRTGCNFIGYYDSQVGGTKYYNADGTSATNWDKTDSTATLYAHWNLYENININLYNYSSTEEDYVLVGTVIGEKSTEDNYSFWSTENAIIPTEPPYEGAKFLGYTIDGFCYYPFFYSNGTTPYNSEINGYRGGEVIDNKINLYANWDETPEYRIDAIKVDDSTYSDSSNLTIKLEVSNDNGNSYSEVQASSGYVFDSSYDYQCLTRITATPKKDYAFVRYIVFFFEWYDGEAMLIESLDPITDNITVISMLECSHSPSLCGLMIKVFAYSEYSPSGMSATDFANEFNTNIGAQCEDAGGVKTGFLDAWKLEATNWETVTDKDTLTNATYSDADPIGLCVEKYDTAFIKNYATYKDSGMTDFMGRFTDAQKTALANSRSYSILNGDSNDQSSISVIIIVISSLLLLSTGATLVLIKKRKHQ